MKQRILGLAIGCWAACGVATAETVVLHNAQIVTEGVAGVIPHGSLVIEDGVIKAMGANVSIPANAKVVELNGGVITPALFGGLAEFGVREVDSESQTDDSTLKLGQMRPEFDPSLAFNPESTALSVSRVEGIGFGVVVPGASYSRRGASNGSIISGQTAIARFDGRGPRGPRYLSIELGRTGAELAGGSRAAVYMWLDQAFNEAMSAAKDSDDQRILTPEGRRVLKQLLEHSGTVLLYANRAADIREGVTYALKHKLKPIVVGGAEAWRVTGLLASQHVPVIVDPLTDLPESFDQIGSTLENAARLHKAGVSIAFSLTAQDQAMARKLRQAAGNAVAHGLDWDTAMAAITVTPAQIFGVDNEYGRLAVGRRANLTVWTGDPLEMSSLVQGVWLDGHEQSLVTRQTLLRDRYLPKVQTHQAK